MSTFLYNCVLFLFVFYLLGSFCGWYSAIVLLGCWCNWFLGVVYILHMNPAMVYMLKIFTSSIRFIFVTFWGYILVNIIWILICLKSLFLSCIDWLLFCLWNTLPLQVYKNIFPCFLLKVLKVLKCWIFNVSPDNTSNCFDTWYI